MEAARPRRPAEVLADALLNYLQGKPINAEATIGAVDSLFGGLGEGMGEGYRPDISPGESEARAHRRQSSRDKPHDGGWWWQATGQAHAVDPREAEARSARCAARQVLGFTQDEILTQDAIRSRRTQLARKFHPDRAGADVARARALGERMAAINAAADVLVDSLPQAQARANR
jgi:hypothetical protein